MSEVIVKLTSDHIKVKGGEYVRDIVRCAECMWKDTFKCRMRNTQVPRYPNDDDFCSYGEVRDE